MGNSPFIIFVVAVDHTSIKLHISLLVESLNPYEPMKVVVDAFGRYAMANSQVA